MKRINLLRYLLVITSILRKKALYKTHIAAAENGDRKVGVIWHTQGSGKLFMLMYARQLVLS